MKLQPDRIALIKRWEVLKQTTWEKFRVPLTALGVAGFIMGLRLSGLLQPIEWAGLDLLFRTRPLEPKDERIVIVGINEDYINKLEQWPMSDARLAQLLQIIQAAKPRAIGLDIYRNFPVEPGHDELVQTMQSIPNLVGIERVEDEKWAAVPPPPTLDPKRQVGFNNIVVDSDRKVRRNIIYWWTADEKTHKSFGLQLALMYLEPQNIKTKSLPEDPYYLQFGKGVLKPFVSNDGAYIRADDAGYQILANFRGPTKSFNTVDISQVLSGQVPDSFFQDRIVIIGSTAVSLKDYFDTPYTSSFLRMPVSMDAVELHANFVSQLLSLALENRPLIQVWPDFLEGIWILFWSWIGAGVVWKVRSSIGSALSILLAALLLMSICYASFLMSWWIPLVSPMLALWGSFVAITAYFANMESELKKSKEFLYSVINTIPDPIFVKDQNHRWIVLNQAYCQFIGYPYESLIEKSEINFLSPQEAEHFWQQDEWVLNTGQAHESEEKFTNAQGITYQIATKRSLHRDAAGNRFLVGVMRDITERKQMEEELKRTAAELARSNEELKLSEDRLRHLAYHDNLTGLPNRKLFHERLSQAIDWARLNSQMVGLLFLDLDGFKEVNDTLGHEIGDLLLKAVAGRLTGCLRGSDTVSRLGGDEFTVILPAIPSIADAARVADKILVTLAKPYQIENHVIFVTTSIGISLYPLQGEDMDTLINQADAAMYQAKDQGKNCFQIALALES
jgi:diguanylate cyclase (GGDEF)-like protein/PAS domain S-box-containing protein